jgi:FMN-dependent NADH-azoreductase
MKLLHIDSSVLGPHSVSRQVSAAIVDRLRKATPGLEIVYRDLSSTPLAHLSGSHLAAAQGAAPEAALQHLRDVLAPAPKVQRIRAELENTSRR